jgi:dTDP-glucose pyrophosphorylase
MWGIVPAAGRGSRIQPLAFSKELLPVGSRLEGGCERPCAVSEYLVDRMVRGGADKLCFVIGPGKSDILEYYGNAYRTATAVYVVQPSPAGLCDAIFRVAPLVSTEEAVLVGLPDTVWFPEDGLADLPNGVLAMMLFPVDRPELFDAVVLDGDRRVREIRVKQLNSPTSWIWGAFKMPGRVFHDLKQLWFARDCRDEYVGSLLNAYLAAGGEVLGIKSGRAYVDVGTLNGYRAAIRLLSEVADSSNGPPEPEPGFRPP